MISPEIKLFTINSFWKVFTMVNPLLVLPAFISLTNGQTKEQKLATAVKCTAIALTMFVVFVFAGNALMKGLDISEGAFRIAGGFLLGIGAVRMVVGEDADDSVEDEKKKKTVRDVSVYPMAFPMMTGPGALVMIFTSMLKAPAEPSYYIAMVLIGVVCLGLVFVSFMFADPILKFIGKAGTNIMQRLLGIILVILSSQVIVTGGETCVAWYKARAEKIEKDAADKFKQEEEEKEKKNIESDVSDNKKEVE